MLLPRLRSQALPNPVSVIPSLNLWLPWGSGLGTTWFQDASAATPATANGDAVRVMNDISQNFDVGGKSTQYKFETTGDSTRPTVNISAGERPSLAFDGTKWLYGGASDNSAAYPGLWRGGTDASNLASFCVHFWVYPSTVSSVITIASRWQTAASDGGWWVHYSNVAAKWQAFFRTTNVAVGGSPDIQLDSANAATINTWFRVIVGYDHVNKAYTLKINDEATVSTTSLYNIGRMGPPARVGTRATTNTTTLVNLWQGRIGEIVGVARASFTDSELALLKSRGPTL